MTRAPRNQTAGSLLAVGVVLAAAVAGCGDPASSLPRVDVFPVKGKVVTAGGQPLKQGMVEFHPTADRGRVAKGTIGADGSFALKTEDLGDGAPAGEYVVVVKASPQGASPSVKDTRSPVPLKFQDVETSPLKQTVNSSPNDVTITLK